MNVSTPIWQFRVLSPGKPLAWACLLLGLLARPAAAQLTPEALIGGAMTGVGPYYQDVSDAIGRFRAGDLPGARKLLASARQKAPRLAPVEVLMANLLIAANQLPAARTELERAIAQEPKDPEAYLRLAELDVSQGQAAPASLLYDKAIQLAEGFDESPKRKRAVQIRALAGSAAIDENREQWAPARDKLQALLKLEPEGAVIVRQRLAKVLFKLGDMKAAFSELQAAQTGEDKAMPPELGMAAFCSQAGDKANADKWVRALIKKNNTGLVAQYGLARWFMQTGDLKQSQTHADAALEADPKNIDVQTLRGILARMNRDLPTAEKLLVAAHLAAPMNAETNNQLALVLLESPDEAVRLRGLAFAELNQRLNPNNIEFAGTLAWALMRAGRTSDAEQIFNAITSTGSINSESLYYLASFRKEQGRLADAKKLLEAALAQDMPMYYRPEAKKLLAELAEKIPAETAPSAEPKKKPAERTPAETETPAPKKPAPAKPTTSKSNPGK